MEINNNNTLFIPTHCLTGQKNFTITADTRKRHRIQDDAKYDTSQEGNNNETKNTQNQPNKNVTTSKTANSKRAERKGERMGEEEEGV